MIGTRRRAVLRRHALALAGAWLRADIDHGNAELGMSSRVTRLTDEECELVEQTIMHLAHRLIDGRIRLPSEE